MQRKQSDQKDLQAVRLSLQAELEKVQRSGVELFVDGMKASPDEVVSRCVQEHSVYMPDYVLGVEGTLQQLRFDKVNAE